MAHDMNSGIWIIKYLAKRRKFKHIAFWICIVAFFTLFSSFENGFKEALVKNLLYLVTDIPLVYIILYYVWPRFFVKGRIFLSFVLVLSLLTGSLLYARFVKYDISPFLGFNVEPDSFFSDTLYSLVVLGFITGLALLLKLYEENFNIRLREEENKKLRAEAELKMLRFQINPHFLFNSLISIQGLMYHNTRLADKMLTELSEFLRYTLRYNQLVFVPLKQEIEIIEKYLGIEKIRFGKKLSYNFSIEPKTRDMEVLCFLLQPLVENAIKHGMKSNPQGVEVAIRSEMNSDWLTIEIMNTGKLNLETLKLGTGIKNVKERLGNAYPDNQRFNILQKDNWVHTIIKIRNS